jgi:hypothetical protein
LQQVEKIIIGKGFIDGRRSRSPLAIWRIAACDYFPAFESLLSVAKSLSKHD